MKVRFFDFLIFDCNDLANINFLNNVTKIHRKSKQVSPEVRVTFSSILCNIQ